MPDLTLFVLLLSVAVIASAHPQSAMESARSIETGQKILQFSYPGLNKKPDFSLELGSNMLRELLNANVVHLITDKFAEKPLKIPNPPPVKVNIKPLGNVEIKIANLNINSLRIDGFENSFDVGIKEKDGKTIVTDTRGINVKSKLESITLDSVPKHKQTPFDVFLTDKSIVIRIQGFNAAASCNLNFAGKKVIGSALRSNQYADVTISNGLIELEIASTKDKGRPSLKLVRTPTLYLDDIDVKLSGSDKSTMHELIAKGAIPVLKRTIEDTVAKIIMELVPDMTNTLRDNTASALEKTVATTLAKFKFPLPETVTIEIQDFQWSLANYVLTIGGSLKYYDSAGSHQQEAKEASLLSVRPVHPSAMAQ